MAPGLDLTAWAPDGLVVDPVALDFDERGTLYATSTSRTNLPLDIRQHPVMGPCRARPEDGGGPARFYRRELAPERSAENPWLPDYNKDGSRDWRDLAEVKERLYRIQDTDGDGRADLLPNHDRGLQRRIPPSTSPAGCSITTAICSSERLRRCGGSATRTATASSTRGSSSARATTRIRHSGDTASQA